MSAASPTQVVEGNGLTKNVASRDVMPTTPSPALGAAMRSIAGRLARFFEFSNPEPHWTTWREVDALDRAPRV